VTVLAYVVGLSAISTGSGERIRFAILAYMLPVFVYNVASLCGVLQKKSPNTLEDALFPTADV
jgi:hypothetical protein